MRCPCGGTVDADDSKSSAREGMGVRVSLGAFLASSRRSLGRFIKGAQAGKPCVSINPIWQTWQPKIGCGLDSVLACLSQCCKAQSTCQRQAVGGACRIHFRDRAARLSPPCAAASSSTIQNSASSAIEVACPASLKERLIRWRGTLSPQGHISYCDEALTF